MAGAWLAVGVAHGGDPLFGYRAPELSRAPGAFASRYYPQLFPPLSLGVSLGTSLQGRLADCVPGGYRWEIGAETGLPLPLERKGSPGGLALNSARTLGATGEVAMAISYAQWSYRRFNGRLLENVLDTPPVPLFEEFPELGYEWLDGELDIDTRVLAFSTVYALNERTDVGLVLPLVSHNWSGWLNSRFVDVHGRETIFPEDRWSGGATGLGDVMLFWKRLDQHWEIRGPTAEGSHQGDVYLGWSQRLKLPTGDDSDRALLGTGAVEYKCAYLLTMARDQYTLNLDLGYNFNGLGWEYNAVEYRAGFTWECSPRVTLVGELLGAWSELSVYRSIEGLIGFKYRLVDKGFVDFGVRFPLNEEGLQAEWIPILAMEYRF